MGVGAEVKGSDTGTTEVCALVLLEVKYPALTAVTLTDIWEPAKLCEINSEGPVAPAICDPFDSH